MKVEGRCHCGAIRFEALVDPAKVVICHCSDCQVLSGSPFRAVVATQEGTLKILSGTPKVYEKTGDSGNRRELAFCPDCGTSLYSNAAAGGTVHALRLGVLQQKDELAPREQYWVRSSMRWLDRLPEFKKYQTQPEFDAKGGFGQR